MYTKLQEITEDYWRVSHARSHPDSVIRITTSDAIHMCNRADELPSTQWRLKELMHTLKFDLIEGSTKWRNTPKHQCQIILWDMKCITPQKSQSPGV